MPERQFFDPSGITATGSDPALAAYLKENPDVMREALKVQGARFPTPESYARWHFQRYGIKEGRTSPQDLLTQEKEGVVDDTPGSSLLSEVTLTDEEKAATRLPQRGDSNIQRVARQARLTALKSGGRSSTILTSGRGVKGQANIKRKKARQTNRTAQIFNNIGQDNNPNVNTPAIGFPGGRSSSVLGGAG